MLPGQYIEETRETLNSLNASTEIFTLGLFQRQLRRFQDLSDGGGLSSSVELLFLALKYYLHRYHKSLNPHSMFVHSGS